MASSQPSTLRAPGTGAGQGTFPVSNDMSKSVTGYYLDASNVFHGFVRALDGTITTFDAPHAGAGTYQGTFSLAINPSRSHCGRLSRHGRHNSRVPPDPRWELYRIRRSGRRH